MTADFAPRVLLVDDEALRLLRETPPDILISDLRMPNMSGFELLAIIRRRFAQIAVIVISGEFIVNVETSGLLMNAFFQKGKYRPQQLIASMRELYGQCPMRPPLAKPSHAPLWINRRNSEYLLATCTECLRSFPIDSDEAAGEGLQTTECPSCGTTITYAVDSNVLKMLEDYKSVKN